MKILQVHNYYKLFGGEDILYNNEYELLTSNGHYVIQYSKKNKEIENFNLLQKVSLFFDSAISKKSYEEISSLIRKEKPNICHVHNTLALISPSVYFACKDNKIPVVQTLHNYRLLCSNAYFFRNGNICEECLGGSLYHSVKYGCYRNSKIQTFALARMIEKHRKLNTWFEKIDMFISPSNFTRQKYIEGGFPEDKIMVKPNFLIEDSGFNYSSGDYFIFAGRMDELKGIKILNDAAKNFSSDIKIKLAGEVNLEEEIVLDKSLESIGFIPHNILLEVIKNSIALIFPSTWYETFGVSIIEAFACGKSVIASNHGAMAELIEDGKTGLLFEPGNSKDLAEKINWAYHHKNEMREMGKNARKEYEEKYTAEKNYQQLMNIYKEVISNYKS